LRLHHLPFILLKGRRKLHGTNTSRDFHRNTHLLADQILDALVGEEMQWAPDKAQFCKLAYSRVQG